jgi:hypothetical protein
LLFSSRISVNFFSPDALYISVWECYVVISHYYCNWTYLFSFSLKSFFFIYSHVHTLFGSTWVVTQGAEWTCFFMVRSIFVGEPGHKFSTHISRIIVSSSWIVQFILCFLIDFCIKFAVSYMRIATLACFWVLHAWYLFLSFNS